MNDPVEAGVPAPTLGRIVIYRSRTGDYDVPAVVTCTAESIAQRGVEMFAKTDGKAGVPPLTGVGHVHLTVLTPGIPSELTRRADAEDFIVEPEHGLPVSENASGTYQEWDIPMNCANCEAGGETPMPGTWRWPARV